MMKESTNRQDPEIHIFNLEKYTVPRNFTWIFKYHNGKYIIMM
jgi:hypothetical protein